MYSGIGPTSVLNEMFMTLMLRTLKDEFDHNYTHFALFGDNFAVDAELTEYPNYEKAATFCGFQLEDRTFGPISLCTDNPKHRLIFPNNTKRQVQSQGIQYFMRPLLSTVMNGVADPRSTLKFLDFVIENKIFEIPQFRSGPKDALEEAFLQRPAVHEKFVDKFEAEMKWVERWFPIQKNNPEYVSDYRVF